MSAFRLSKLFSSRPAPAPTVVANDAGDAALRQSAAALEVLLTESARRLPDPPPPPVEVVEEDVEAGRPVRVLLAEDHPVNRKVVELILASIGAEITCVENGALAVDAFRRQAFDVVLMDMQMPVMDGLTATREIRGIEASAGRSRTPILSLTANAMPEHVDASFAAGADDHLTKPVNAPGLIAAVETAMVAKRADTPLRRSA